MKPRSLLTFAIISGMLAVIAGAFGAHALKAVLDPQALGNWETAVRYQFYHVFAIMASIWLFDKKQDKLALRAGIFFLIGILLFSGSLYLLAVRSLVSVNLLWLGPVTPLGGLCFILGWVCLLIVVRRPSNQ